MVADSPLASEQLGNGIGALEGVRTALLLQAWLASHENRQLRFLCSARMEQTIGDSGKPTAPRVLQGSDHSHHLATPGAARHWCACVLVHRHYRARSGRALVALHMPVLEGKPVHIVVVIDEVGRQPWHTLCCDWLAGECWNRGNSEKHPACSKVRLQL